MNARYVDAKRAAEEIRLEVRDMSNQCRCIGYTLAHLVVMLQKATIDDTNEQLLTEAGLSNKQGHHRGCLTKVLRRLEDSDLVRRDLRPVPHGERGTFYSTTFLTLERSLPDSRAEVPGSLPGFAPDHCPVSGLFTARSPGDTLDTSLDTPSDNDPLVGRALQFRAKYSNDDALADEALDQPDQETMEVS